LSVTDFFRDSAAFDVLQRDVVPCLFEGKEAKDTIRVWVAGCATGEEAYSVTMQLLDHAASLSQPPEVQVFASDVNEEAVAAAREGLYPASIELDVTPARLRSFFLKEPGG